MNEFDNDKIVNMWHPKYDNYYIGTLTKPCLTKKLLLEVFTREEVKLCLMSIHIHEYIH